MGRASARITVPGRASEAEALWYDPVRWPAWVDGFGHVVELPEGWPQHGRLAWNGVPGGRERVIETVTAFEPRAGQSLRVEDAKLRGTQRVAFAPGADTTTVTLELAYELKQRTPLTPLIDLLFTRRQLTASLQRTLEAFARERRADTELESVTKR